MLLLLTAALMTTASFINLSILRLCDRFCLLYANQKKEEKKCNEKTRITDEADGGIKLVAKQMRTKKTNAQFKYMCNVYRSSVGIPNTNNV